MKISELFKNNKCVFSFEVFPPKKDTSADSIYKTLDSLKALSPDFISVTYGAGGTNGDNITGEIASYINKAKQLTELYHYFGNHPQKLHDKFLNLLEDSDGKTQFWGVLRSYVDAAFDNATEKIKSKYPDLTDSEITVICMLLCDFSNVLISVYMGYKSPHYVYNKKKMIALF